MTDDLELFVHREWLGLIQPVGLVVTARSLARAEATPDRADGTRLQPILRELLDKDGLLSDLRALMEQILEWDAQDLVAAPEGVEYYLENYGETLKPSYVVINRDELGVENYELGITNYESGSPIRNSQFVIMMLVQEVEAGTGLDDKASSQGWEVTPQQKFERLLRGLKIPMGLLTNGKELRLVYAPEGESSGYLTFSFAAMAEVAGRSLLSAFYMLLSSYRVFQANVMGDDRRLCKILENSRLSQNEVSERLADQVLDALWELLAGFQAADAAVNGKILTPLSPTGRGAGGEGLMQHIYGGLVTVLMRLVFLLYAEERDVMPDDAMYQGNYAVTGLYDRLRDDASNYPDTMEQRFGAWAWLLSLFRLVYDGGGATEDYLPARKGQLFKPDEYPFLEGYGEGVPRVSDGTIFRVLDKLLILEGDRLSYRSLDVENIGSVYEGIMGYRVERAESVSLGVTSKPKGSKISTTVVVDMQALLVAKGSDRAGLLKTWANCEVTGNALKELKEAKTLEGIAAALGRKVSHRTQNLLAVGALFLQPTEERRRSGSHYTPRKLTEPIVRKTLEPIFAGLGSAPTAAQVLSLKVCDLAMGSGAFLVEACRQLADAVVAAWERDGMPDDLPKSEEPILIARRLVAQRCIYGVDKNPFAVNLAKLSLWLATLAKNYPFTFIDHALKCGDSLVGLTSREIGAFESNTQLSLFRPIADLVKDVVSKRLEIQSQDTLSDRDADVKHDKLMAIDADLSPSRRSADAKIAAFFDGKNAKDRTNREQEYKQLLAQGTKEELEKLSQNLRSGDRGIIPFNWEIEFPEVFTRQNSGFDAIVGNPPFLGGKRISTVLGDEYRYWLPEIHPETHSNGDLVAHFFRRAFNLLRKNGTFGLIATNSIAQGDTRTTGLRFICENGGTIYNAQKRVKWAGDAAVIVSVLNVIKGVYTGIKKLDGKDVPLISAFLFYKGGNQDPKRLLANSGKSFQGSIVLGMGFTFDDSNPDATSIEEMHRLIEKDPKNSERIFPYIGGEEVNTSPTHSHHRYVINFGEMTEQEAKDYPDLYKIVRDKVYPDRKDKPGSYSRQWWLFGRRNQEGTKAIAPLERVLVISRISKSCAFTFLPKGMVYNEKIVVFTFDKYSAFLVLQSRIHEIWTRFFSSTLKDDLQYTPSDCFETFPFPTNWENNPQLEAIGKEYYEYRAQLMISNNQGLTATYNRFHDPDEYDQDILKLRDLHNQMDRAVLDAYGWTDLQPTCEFLLDYEDEEETLTPDPSPTGRGEKRQKKKPYRYRWADEIRDEVLARLLALNEERYQEEVLRGDRSEGKSKKAKGKTKGKQSAANNPELPFA
ncbi:N-6 DNA methylase [Pseudanabaena sp. FACHB-1277]|uniref:site-specific DNA-methyltransferase (adenine-specific) n=1 Tax=Pseudanabaena cinerea FACHB-1277 TaxID=2949581 RepID=A0A926USH2_9CYAN|nr:DNA methyltransferase [Pseudanabaena cinerea]MBD2150431.1 N-6 DNA methylase [Pseudanabaena cinerea FACHB-1277]